jgi:hypothetical protein
MIPGFSRWAATSSTESDDSRAGAKSIPRDLEPFGVGRGGFFFVNFLDSRLGFGGWMGLEVKGEMGDVFVSVEL